MGVRTMKILLVTGMSTVPNEKVRGKRRSTPSRGGRQKTGWFYDQRHNRVEAAKYAKGKTVLDAFCYAGAFGVMAARNGAAGVTFLDASRQALDMASRNLAANAGCPGETLPGDALDTLASLRDGGRKFGVVCVDPPAFIKRKKDAEQGLNAYRRVNDLGLQLVENGGILTSCSCSHHLEAEALRRLIAQCAAKRGLNTQLLYQGFQGPDHPVHPSMPETAYLKVFYPAGLERLIRAAKFVTGTHVQQAPLLTRPTPLPERVRLALARIHRNPASKKILLETRNHAQAVRHRTASAPRFPAPAPRP